MRTCGECTVCCKQTRVPELRKEVGTTCSHCDQGCTNRGCTIYDDRPQSCRDFQCEWLKGKLPDDLRPDICGVMLEKIHGHDLVIAMVNEEWANLVAMTPVLEAYVRDNISVCSSIGFALLAEGVTEEGLRATIRQAQREAGY